MTLNEMIDAMQEIVRSRPDLGQASVRVHEMRDDLLYYTVADIHVNEYRFVFPMIILRPIKD
jgi:hypothetical protein